MQWYETEVGTLEERLRDEPIPRGCTAFYGSSSIRMWDDLAVDLNDERAVNVGFGGSTLAACVHFFKRLVPPLHPASLVVYAGDNDLGDGCRPEDVLGSFRKLADLVQNFLPNIGFGFISIKISPARVCLRENIVKTNELIRRDMRRVRCGYYIDICPAMLDLAGCPRSEFFCEDGLHLSRTGYALWGQLLRQYRDQMFTSLLPKNGSRSVTLDDSEP